MTLDMLRCALRGVAAYRHIVEETLLQRVLSLLDKLGAGDGAGAAEDYARLFYDLRSEGSRSLKRLFVDAGLSVEARERTPAIFVGGRLAAVPGIGVDRAFAPRPGRAQYVLDFHRK